MAKRHVGMIPDGCIHGSLLMGLCALPAAPVVPFWPVKHERASHAA